ncbi:hypothetical protein NESM_000523400 [Novymonas esmeraldas]|uniref:Uncharacterized protein n=1 Tax=Novymonas esmeraldas TaxID=1808958 RepID=A0AAW0EQZ0_9TRYP
MRGGAVVDAAGASLSTNSKHSVYAEAADPERYRIADAPLFSCVEHGEACVLCVTAGKNGRNGRTAAVGATLFWLTCPNLNAVVARWEGHRCVQAVSDVMARHAVLLDWHVQSHDVYARRAEALLTPAQWSFFAAHFQSPTEPSLHKYGNAAVSHAGDMKCLHALVAQTLADAANPVGSVVVNYLLLQHQLVHEAESASDAAHMEAEERRRMLRAVLDSTLLFEQFLQAFVSAATERRVDGWSSLHGACIDVPLPEDSIWGAASVQYIWCGDTQLATLSPDICTRALTVLVALEGKPPRRHKKHRIN